MEQPPYSASELRLIELWERHLHYEFAAKDARHFIPKMPADTAIELVCRTVGQSRVIDELIFEFTHDLEMDWMLPGVPPTGRRVEVPLVVVVVVQTDGERVVFERIYWDQGSVRAQLGLLDPALLPVAGAETARKVLDPALPSNELIHRARSSRRSAR